MDETTKTYEVIAADWERDHAEDIEWKEGAETFLATLAPRGLILDVGCGPGFKAAHFAARGFPVFGIDSSLAMCDRAAARVPQATFFPVDMRKATKAMFPCWFDGIYAMASLLHLPKAEVDGVLIAFRALLMPGGALFISVKALRPGEPEEALVTETDYGTPYTRFFSFFTEEELRERLERTGFVRVQIRSFLRNETRWIEVLAHRP